MKSNADWISLKAKMDKDEELQPLLQRMAQAGELKQAIMSAKEMDPEESADHMENMKEDAKEDAKEGEEDDSEGFTIRSIKDLKAAYEMFCKEERVGSKKNNSK